VCFTGYLKTQQNIFRALLKALSSEDKMRERSRSRGEERRKVYKIHGVRVLSLSAASTESCKTVFQL